METISKDDCIQIGFFRKTHGVHGELVLEYEPKFELSISETDRFFVEMEGFLVPFFIPEDGFRFKSSNSVIVKFDWVNTEAYAKRMTGSSVYLFKKDIVYEEENSRSGKFLNWIVNDKNSITIGMITHVDDFSGNIVLTISRKGEEILIPYNEDFLISYDESQKIITLDLPEGLLED